MLVCQGFPRLSSMVQLCLSLLPLPSNLQWAWQTHPVSTTSNISPVMDSMPMVQVKDKSTSVCVEMSLKSMLTSHQILQVWIHSWVCLLMTCPSPFLLLYFTPHPHNPAFDDLSQAHGEYSKGGYGGSAQSQSKSAGSGPGKGKHIFLHPISTQHVATVVFALNHNTFLFSLCCQHQDCRGQVLVEEFLT